MEAGGSSESPADQPKRGKSKTPRKAKDSVLKQSSFSSFFSSSLELAHLLGREWSVLFWTFGVPGSGLLWVMCFEELFC